MEFLNHMTHLFLNFWEIFILVNLNSCPLDYFITSQFQGLEKASNQELRVKFWDSGGSPKPRKICHFAIVHCSSGAWQLIWKEWPRHYLVVSSWAAAWIFFLLCCCPLLVKGSNLWLFSHFLLVHCAEIKKKVVSRLYCVHVCFVASLMSSSLWPCGL